MSTKHSAIEAAARDSYEQGDQYYGAWDSLDPILREYAIKNAGITIRAYLSAIAEDEASVEAVARAMCIEKKSYRNFISQRISMRQYPKCSLLNCKMTFAKRSFLCFVKWI